MKIPSARSAFTCLSRQPLRALAAPLLLVTALTTAAAAGSTPIDLGTRLELFVDDFLIDRMDGVRLQQQTPRSEGTVLTFDRPWEGNTSGYTSLFKDGDRYRMYYRGSADPTYTIKATVRPDERILPVHDQFTCYAESTDGVHWVRPNLGLFEFNGSKENNIVWVERGSHNFAPFKDENPAAPADRIVLLYIRAVGAVG